MMKWIKDRIVEPTSWLAVGIGAIVLSMLIPKLALTLMIIAAVTVAAGVIMKEKGNG
jgi:hypothetical protein